MSDEFFVKEPVDPENVPDISSFDAQAIKIPLSSAGRLDMPAILHVRDYTMEDALKLSMTQDEDILRVLIGIVGGMVQEDVDINKMHENELEEIMLSIYSNFWNKTFYDFPFPYTEEDLDMIEDEEKRIAVERGEKVLRTDVPIKNISTSPIREDFREPITIKNGGLRISFRLPRLGDYIVADNYVTEKYAAQEKRFEDLKNTIEYNESVGNDPTKIIRISGPEMKEYQKYLKKRGEDYFRVTQAQILQAIDGKSLEKLKDKLDARMKLNLSFWRDYQTALKQIHFGVDPKVKVKSPITNKNVTRRFQFRIVDYLPSVDTDDGSGVDLQFGDEG